MSPSHDTVQGVSHTPCTSDLKSITLDESPTKDMKDIADQVKQQFPQFNYSQTIRWGKIERNGGKVDMAKFAHELLSAKGYPTARMVDVLDELNIDAREGNTDSLNTSLAKTLRKEQPVKKTKRVKSTKVTKKDRFLTEIDNSVDAKIAWIKRSLTGGRKNSRRGGAFVGDSRKGINKIALLDKCKDNCPYCEHPLNYAKPGPLGGYNSKDKDHQSTLPSLDRINPKETYTTENAQVICNRCNTLKNNATVEEIVILANAMQKQQEIMKKLS